MDFEEVLVVAIVFGSVIVITWMIIYAVVRSKESARQHASGAGAMGMSELEERIQRAVRAANEPLRRDVKLLRDELEGTRGTRRGQEKLPGGAIHETPLLAERGPGEGAEFRDRDRDRDA